MLVLTRRLDEELVIGEGITVTVLAIRGDRVRLGIKAPKEIPVHRQEICNRAHSVPDSCRLYEMANAGLMLHRERLLALRARLLGDMTQMEDNALNKDHSRTTSMPTSMAELGSGNFDQELTLSLLGNEKDAFDQMEH